MWAEAELRHLPLPIAANEAAIDHSPDELETAHRKKTIWSQFDSFGKSRLSTHLNDGIAWGMVTVLDDQYQVVRELANHHGRAFPHGLDIGAATPRQAV